MAEKSDNSLRIAYETAQTAAHAAFEELNSLPENCPDALWTRKANEHLAKTLKMNRLHREWLHARSLESFEQGVSRG